MTIPDFQTVMLPLLEIAKDGKDHSIHEAVSQLAEHFRLTDDEKTELLSSGQQPVFDNRVGWARTHLKKAGLLEYPRRGYFRITQRGRNALEMNPVIINIQFLNQYEEFKQFRNTRRIVNPPVSELNGELTPEEALEEAYQKIRDDLADKLLESVGKATPAFFEKLVVELLVNMGYGGSRRDAARAVGQSGDEGIDGVIDEDRLGLDAIYIQAKKWKDGSVGRPEIQKFVGALQGQRAKKGIFITTAQFSEGAKEYVRKIDTRVILIDGTRLAELMIDYNVGVSHQITYEIKSLDTDYFESL